MKIGHQLFNTSEFLNLTPVARIHRRNGFGVGNAKLKGKGLVGRRSREKDAHCLGETQPHRSKGIGRLKLQLLIDPNMNHRTGALHNATLSTIVYELRYKTITHQDFDGWAGGPRLASHGPGLDFPTWEITSPLCSHRIDVLQALEVLLVVGDNDAAVGLGDGGDHHVEGAAGASGFGAVGHQARPDDCGPSAEANHFSNRVRFFPAGFSSTPNQISATVREAINKSSSACSDSHVMSGSEGAGLVTLLMISVSSRKRVTG